MADSSSSGASKKRFAIPSANEIEEFENSKPKIPSRFRSKNATSHGGSSSGVSSVQQGSVTSNATFATSSSRFSSSSGHEPFSRQKDAKGGPASVGVSRTEQDETSRTVQGRSASITGQTAMSSESAEAMRTSLELRKQRADEALRERLEAGAAAPTLQRPRAVEAPRGRLEEASNATTSNTTSASSAGGGRNPAASNPYRLPQASEIARRGKIGSSFASKFHMLGTAEEYKIPQAAVKQSTSDSAVPGTSAGVNKAPSGNSVIVNPRQRGNPILKHVRNVPWEFGDIVPDYVMGRTTCAFYLSLRYHNLNPNYISDRLTELGHKFDLRVLLVQVDVKDPHHSVKELARLAILSDCTLMLAWNAEEAGRYIETYKAYENKPVDALKEKVEQNHLSKMTDCLTTVKSVNKTDVITLLANCGTFEKIVESSKEELALLPGFGPQKAERLSSIFTEPFLRRNKRRIVQTEKDEDGEG
ncbi:DNA excision repair protein ERCC-1 [Strongylocentrotus purpuratus]|uniref:DNA excision repair protein ERCC-1 n=1 Tax=Strongylocentrotus purpuratus TaxID=7668 RepID=A0A7M7NRD0_STRPU|nr:DNA excision repair protein ERCC-1 [Strongylocentrotus purpuratus]